MRVSLIQEVTAMLWMLLCGALWGVLYDAVRILRRAGGLDDCSETGKRLRSLSLPLIGADASNKKKRIAVLDSFWIAVLDILFCTAAGCMFSVVLANFAYGVFRWFYLVAALCGLGMYHISVSRVVLGLTETVLFLLRTLLRYVCRILQIPLRLANRVLRFLQGKVIQCIWIPYVRRSEKQKRFRYTQKTKKELTEEFNIL